MGPMRTAVVSDLHLGGLADADVARDGKPLEALAEAVADADRLVLLGDVVELRERPLAQALEVSRARCSRRSGARWPGARSCSCPATTTTRSRSRGSRACGSTASGCRAEAEWPVGPEDGAAGRIAGVDAGRAS